MFWRVCRLNSGSLPLVHTRRKLLRTFSVTDTAWKGRDSHRRFKQTIFACPRIEPPEDLANPIRTAELQKSETVSRSSYEEFCGLTRQCFSSMRLSHPGRVIPSGHLGML